MYKYLSEQKMTLEELKKDYHRFAKMLHSDNGGNDEEMKMLNAEYAELFAKVKDVHITKDGEEYRKETTEAPEEFTDLIQELLKMNGIRIEVIGCFIWVSGETRPHKETLKSLSFQWHRKKQCWYKSPAGYRRFGKGEYSMDRIRGMYGTQYEEKVQLNEIEEQAS